MPYYQYTLLSRLLADGFSGFFAKLFNRRKSFDGRLCVHLTRKLYNQMAAACAGGAVRCSFFGFTH